MTVDLSEESATLRASMDALCHDIRSTVNLSGSIHIEGTFSGDRTWRAWIPRILRDLNLFTSKVMWHLRGAIKSTPKVNRQLLPRIFRNNLDSGAKKKTTMLYGLAPLRLFPVR